VIRKNSIYITIIILTIIIGTVFALFNYTYVSENNNIAKATDIIEVTWPLENVNLFENQVFTVNLSAIDTSKVRVFWELEGGVMGDQLKSDGTTTYKSEVDTSKWDWKKDNKYNLIFLVKDEKDTIVATTSLFVYVGDTRDVVAQTEQETIDTNVQPATQTATVYQPLSNSKPVVVAANTNLATLKVEWVMSDIKNNQKFIYRLSGYNEDDIIAYWNSEGGHKNLIYKTDSTTPFTAAINIFGWRWKDKGPYNISFTIADKKTSTVIATETFEMYWKGEPGNSEIEINNISSKTLASVAKPATPEIKPVVPVVTQTPAAPVATSTPVATTTKPVISNPAIVSPATNAKINTFTKTKLFTPNKPAVTESLAKLTKPTDIEAIKFILNQPSSVWLNGDAYEDNDFIQSILKKAKENNQIPTFVLYNIPNRDCGSYSSGGTDTIENYKAWIDRLTKNLYLAEAIVIVEPDALAQLNCLPEKDRAGRVAMLKYAVEQIESASPHIMVYIDAGHPFWVNAEEMADRLKKVGISTARGFALNVSNYVSTSDNITYGNYLSNLLGGKKYVIDTSRNGKGPSPKREWCNPLGRALGEAPAITQGKKGSLDATLWIKFPGESDGTCNGGPNAGGFWTQYAIDLYKNR
jgi:endoglucanase